MYMKSAYFLVVLMVFFFAIGIALQSLLFAEGLSPCVLAAAAFSLGATKFIVEHDKEYCLGLALWAGLFIGFIVGINSVDVVLAFPFLGLQILCALVVIHVNRVVKQA